ncbi:polymorphic toxin type 8 domain-containing protein [Erythrobacter sp. JK5]|uniref:polymorphic toxin type 8 domain-containing protein n=1 Tax=Erythrobacter sp. JK5 TaxID=2829500 RepID=UPI00273902E3|nr:polymorphic toxin type 8 domain-containing protein [Erythrobacter sp. JK5]
MRVDKPTGTRHFVYDEWGRVVAEYGASANDVRAEFIWAEPPAANDNAPFGGGDHIAGYAPLALVAPNAQGALQTYWVHGNHLGVPLVTTDAQGTVVDPGNDFLRPGFPGQSQVLADLYYNRNRDYDPVTGRYIQADPIGLAGDVNPYVYANADPVNGIDPLGLMTKWEYYAGLPDSYRRNTMNAIAGWSDGLTFGATWYVREWIGSNRDIDLCNDFYNYAGFFSVRGAARRAGKIGGRQFFRKLWADETGGATIGRSGKQARLRELVNDPKLSSRIRGELRRDLNEIARGKRRRLRVPQGMNLAHKRGFEARRGYGYDNSDLQDIQLHKIQHRIDRRRRR